jgi:hypothetical protein
MGIANITNNILTDSGVTIGAAGGVATLDSGGKIPVSQLPNSVMEFKGTWSAATNTPTLANGTGNAGDVYEVSAAGTVNFGAGGIAFAVGDYVVYDGATWQYSSGQKGTITSLTFSAPLTGGTITTSGTVGIPAATSTVDGYLKASDWVIFNGKQNALTNPVTGTGTTNYVTKFTGASTVGNSLIFDNGTKVGIGTSSIPTSRFLAVSGSAQFNGAALMEGANFSIVPAANGQDGVVLNVGYDTGTDYGSLFINTGGNTSMTLTKNGAVTFASSATATSFVKTGGTSAQFLKADGSVDSSTYVSSSALASYLPLAGGTLTGDLSGTTYNFTSSTNSTWAGKVENLGTTNAHGLNVNIGASSTGVPFRVDKAGATLLIISNNGAALHNGNVITSGANGAFSINRRDTSSYAGGWYSPSGAILLDQVTSGLGTQTVLSFALANGAATFSSSVFVTGDLRITSNEPQIYLTKTGTDAGTWRILGSTGGTLRRFRIYDEAAELDRFDIFSNGNVAIGTTTDAGYKLDVNGTGRFTGALTVDNLIRSNAGIFQVWQGGTFRGGLYNYASASGSGTDYSPTLVSETSLYFATGGSATKKLTIDSAGAATFSSTGSFGNATLNGAYFAIKGANGVPATSGTTTSAVLRLSSGTGLYNVLDFGTNESLDYSWIQSTRANSLGTYDYLAIQPNGGNLLIGTTVNAGYKLDVNGTGRFGASTYKMLSISDAGGAGWATTGGASTAPQLYMYNTGTSAIVQTYINNVARLEVTNTGIAVTGTATFSSSVTVSGTLVASSGGGQIRIDGGSTLSGIFQGTATNNLFIGDWNTATKGITINVSNGNTSIAGDLSLTPTNSALIFSSGFARIFMGSNETIRITSGGDVSVKGTGNYTGVSVSNSTSATIGGGYFNVQSFGTTRGYFAVAGAVSGTTDNNVSIYAEGGSGMGAIKYFVNGSGSVAHVMFANGNVGIGTGTDSGFKLEVNGTLRTIGDILTSSTLKMSGNSSYNWMIQNHNDSNWGFGMFASGVLYYPTVYFAAATGDGDNRGFRVRNVSTSVNVLLVNSVGNATFSGSVTATSFFESSDATIKTLITDNYQAKGIESVVAKLYVKNGKQELGYYAQDVQGILPSAVSKGSDGLLSLSYREVHTAKISALEKRVAELEQQLNLN